MATRGVFQLKSLTIRYCEHGGSSRTLRQFLADGSLASWAQNYPHLNVQIQVRNGKHPVVFGDYRTNTTQHQVCVKNYSTADIREVLHMLVSRSGRKITKFTKPVLTDTPSIQGVWTPFLDLVNEEPSEITIVGSS